MAMFPGVTTDGKSDELASMITSIATNCFNSYTNHHFGCYEPNGPKMFMSCGNDLELKSDELCDWRDDVLATAHGGIIAFYGPKQKQDYSTNVFLRVPIDEKSNRAWFDDDTRIMKNQGKEQTKR
jgi:hypothetical protein